MELCQPSPDSTINFAGTGHESSMQDVSSKFYPNGGSATVAGATNLGVSSVFYNTNHYKRRNKRWSRRKWIYFRIYFT